jgi:exopolyphosphatase/pppGpp-phosphohydrolase
LSLNAQRRAQLRKYLAELRKRRQPAVAVFDVGTKAARILIAPHQVPGGEWTRSTFYNDAVVANLGDDVGPDWTLSTESSALDDVASFLREYRNFLLAEGVKEERIVAAGTAIFRWLTNAQEIVDHLAKMTRLRLHVVPPQAEARLSQTALMATYRFGVHKPVETFSDIILLDQGGGSLEISRTRPDGVDAGIDSLDKFGTLYLKNRFLSLAGDMVGGESFAERMRTFREEIDERITQWGGFSDLRGAPVLVYGMGSALAACMPRMNNYFMHNTLLPADELERRLSEVIDVFSAKQVSEPELEAADEREETDNELSVLHGLPVFLGMLRYFRADRIRFAGYGLRYGLYLKLFRDRVPLAEFEVPPQAEG